MAARVLRGGCHERIETEVCKAEGVRVRQADGFVQRRNPRIIVLLTHDHAGRNQRRVIMELVDNPMMRLQDPTQTKMVIVTLPETTPMLEAEALQTDLRRAGIEPWAWVVNSSLAAASPRDPLLVVRARQELPHIEHVVRGVPRTAVIPWVAREPVGSEQLAELARGGANHVAASAHRERLALGGR